MFQASTSAYVLSNKEVKQRRAAAAKKKKLTNIVRKRRLSESNEGGDPEVVPKAELDNAQDTIRMLRERLQSTGAPK